MVGVRLGKYELGRTLGEGNFGKVKYASNTETGQAFAIKILDKQRILHRKITDQIKREIGTLKLLKHPNVVRLHETKKGRLSEDPGRKLFQQLIDAVTYCHDKGVYHRDLKLENVLIDAEGNIKVSDFGLSALPQQLKEDGLLHTTCGSPHYVAPEVLANKGYDGTTSDLWSCGIILYVILTGYLPFDDRNLAALYHKIFKASAKIPNSLSPGAQNLIRRILDPNPITRISVAEIKEHEWFKQDYIPANPIDEDEDMYIDDKAFSMQEMSSDAKQQPGSPSQINAFELIRMSSFLDLSGFFEKEEVQERKIRFTSNYSSGDLLSKIECIVKEMGFRVAKRNGGKLRVIQAHNKEKSLGSLSFLTEVFDISSSLRVVELSKSYGDSSLYRKLWTKLSNDLGVSTL